MHYQIKDMPYYAGGLNRRILDQKAREEVAILLRSGVEQVTRAKRQ